LGYLFEVEMRESDSLWRQSLPWTARLALAAVLLASSAVALDLSNGVIKLDLEVNAEGVPYIAEAVWCDGGESIFREAAPDRTIAAWTPPGLGNDKSGPAVWQQISASPWARAEACRGLAGGSMMTWVVELPPDSSMLRMHVRVHAIAASAPKPVEWFPVWTASWTIPGGVPSVRWWEALTFQREEKHLSADSEILLGSHVHSSDNNPKGQNPYWVWPGKEGRLFFGVEWCGGWQAGMRRSAKNHAVDFWAWLPPEETQLLLQPGEAVDGPVLMVTATRETDDLGSRAAWMRQRAALGKLLYGGPAPWYPLAYNNWYTTRFDFNGDFLQRQADAMAPYGFDLFVVDAGWYKAVGEWEPDPAKFAPGQFESILNGVKNQGVKVGVWSCPQFVQGAPDHLPPNVDDPPFYRKFIDGYLLDYAGMDFTQFLLDHAAALRTRYGMDWWKYDQDFFVEKTRHGLMKNVIALQNALSAVRKAQPDLYLENCQSGGRMINEFTVLMTQNQWIRDGGNTGPDHARSNFREALGALEFMPPWTVNRWTNNPDRNDPEDDEFTRMYCRGAMAGTWGIVADLPKIPEGQRDIIVREAAHYRRLNALKTACRYEVLPADAKADAAGIVYYDAVGKHAALLLRRWNKKGPFDIEIPMGGLGAAERFRVEDVDLATPREAPATELRANGLKVAFDAARQSALVFVDVVE
jgi:hypothetical protein